MFNDFEIGQLNADLLVGLAAMRVAVVAAIVFLESGRRNVPVQYAKRVVGRRVYGGQSTHIPLKINTAGVIPPIFASSIIAFPARNRNPQSGFRAEGFPPAQPAFPARPDGPRAPRPAAPARSAWVFSGIHP